MEVVKAQSEKCHVDKDETTEVRVARIPAERRRGDCPVNHCRQSPKRTARVIACWPRCNENFPRRPCHTLFREKIQKKMPSSSKCQILRLVFLKKTDAQLEEGLRGVRAAVCAGQNGYQDSSGT